VQVGAGRGRAVSGCAAPRRRRRRGRLHKRQRRATGVVAGADAAAALRVLALLCRVRPPAHAGRARLAPAAGPEAVPGRGLRSRARRPLLVSAYELLRDMASFGAGWGEREGL